MPSELDISTIPEMLSAANASAWARKTTADVHSGGKYDCQAGVGAILWIRQQNRDRDSFRCCYDDTATNSTLDWRITGKGGAARIQSTRGVGSAVIQLAGTPGAGTIWEGTRIAVAGVDTTPRYYRVSADTAIGATWTGAVLPIEAEKYGTGTAIDTSKLGNARLTWEDCIYNTGWSVVSIVCLDGTDRETDPVYRARWRQSKIDRRAGYKKSISDALVAAGAAYVLLLESDFVYGTDEGINRAFVADQTYQSPAALLRRCRKAVDSFRVLGCDLTVWGIARTAANFDLTVTTWDQPGNVDQAAVRSAVQDGILHYFTSRDNGFVYKRDGIRAAAMQQSSQVQAIDFGASDPVDTVIANLMESTALPLLYTERERIKVTLVGP